MPQKVSDEEVEKLKSIITGRKTHKKSIDRDLLIIELLYNAGLRLSELTNLRVTDLRLTGEAPHLKVLQGKGGKDRDVSLNPYICSRLKAFTKGKAPEDKVIGIALHCVVADASTINNCLHGKFPRHRRQCPREHESHAVTGVLLIMWYG